MVSELRTSKIDIETFTSLLGSAALVEDDYRSRVKHVVQRLEPRSPAFELFRQVLERVEPHFVSQAAFNTAFVGDGATVRNFFAAHTPVTAATRWHVIRELVSVACPQPTLSAEEQLARFAKSKAETWADFVDRYLAACTVSTASRETQAKTLYRKLPANLRRLVVHLPPTASPADIRTIIRNMSFWESGASTKTEVDEDAMDIDLGLVQANAATDGRTEPQKVKSNPEGRVERDPSDLGASRERQAAAGRAAQRERKRERLSTVWSKVVLAQIRRFIST